MSASQRYVGKNLHVQFQAGGQTYVLSGDQTALDITDEAKTADVSAGSDDFTTEKPTVRSLSATLQTVHTGASGTATFGQVTVGLEGTLIYGPQGTVAGKPKGGFLAFVSSKPMSIPFNDKVTRSVIFKSQGGEWGTTVFDPDTHVF
jgi:hypothetical protein